MSEERIEVYTDGACLGNPGPGGWSAIVHVPGQAPVWLAGHEPRTTNNRMEITGVIRGLERTPRGAHVRVYSDSQYVINTFTKGWQTKANLDLWDVLKRLVAERRVSWEWVRGHNGIPLNEEADRLATAAAADPSWGPLREGPLGSAPTPSAATPPATAAGQPRLSHLDDEGRARMVDVSEKAVTQRQATARGAVYMQPATLALIQAGGVAKGDVFTVAQVAAVMAAKRTGELIPLCHPLPLTHVEVRFEPDPDRSCVHIAATVRTSAQTGVEMEALTAVSVAALTIYDMCKAADRGMRIGDIRVTHKTGGKSGDFQQE